MKPFIVVCDGMDKEVFEALQAETNLEVHPKAKITQEELKELLPKANALIIRSATTVTKEYLELAPNLNLVIRAGEGTDNIDKKACAEFDVVVENTPGANNNSAAEHAIALMMTVLRKTAAADASMKTGAWDKASFTGNELANKKVGIVGFGKIGQIVAKRLAGFDPEVKVFDPFFEKSDLPYVSKAATLEEIFESCDIITLHTPLMDATRGLVNAKLFNLMKADAILINASRGGIVNEEDLYAALSSKKFRAAGFDVFSAEPLPADNKLKELPNLVMTPHLGAATEEAQLRVGQMAVAQIREYFGNNNIVNQVKA
ncbi:hydroxyacid dehydrogenase [Bacteriovorax sp. Seq25_V]|uniref:hydroxyacid dehydrogenase n=1 Tax=Bacteriovorax sp. Seq25_V TaxID=1201288 RepID=UPI00038A14C7|nr:hydroxyacid dehydrogenase [Bacteriovorax sp. Seq25_V]EQC47554.1 4-phosphoerythronate dehydrogenase [Bacteriovorax sp. Seq25_V]